MRALRLSALGCCALLLTVAADQTLGTGCHVVEVRGTSTPDRDVTVCRQDNWIHRSETPFGNIHRLGVGLGSNYHSVGGAFFDSQRPTASQESLGGSVAVTNGTSTPTRFRQLVTAGFEGDVHGDIDNMALTLYVSTPGRTPAMLDLGLELLIDWNTAWIGMVAAAPVATGSDDLWLLRVLLSDLHVHQARVGQSNAETGDHRIYVNMWPADPDDFHVYWWDTIETPSEVDFNLAPGERAGFSEHTTI